MSILLGFPYISSANTCEVLDAPIFTNQAEDIYISCDSIFNADELFDEWIINYGGAEVDGFCSDWIGFAAVPGSYDTLDFNSFPGTHPNEFDTISCPSNQAGLIRYETVDFVFYDDCNNILVTKATFSIIDTVAPIIIDIPEDVTYSIIDENCFSEVSIIPPVITDNCGEIEPHIHQQINKSITAPLSDVNTIVDTVHFKFGPFNLSSSPAITDANLHISLSNIDANIPTEFFTVQGEDNVILGVTPLTMTECADTFIVFTITASQINSWADDGFIEIALLPNITEDPVLAINDICLGSSTSATLDFDIDVNNHISYSFQIDDGVAIELDSIVPFDTILNVGIYNIKYFFEDCGMNQASCSSIVTIKDTIPPSINCFNDTIINLINGDCNFDYQLPNMISYFDNCSDNHNNLHYFVTGATEIAPHDISSQLILLTLNKGKNDISIVSFDKADNSDTCRYSVTIVDIEPPIIECSDDTLLLDITSTSYIELTTELLGITISDNCAIDSMVFYPDTLTCEEIGTNVEMTITVWDDSGNYNTCLSLLTVREKELQPDYLPINCEGDTLSLVSNITTTRNLNYHWTGPNGFESFESNPVIINPPNTASGSYTLEVNDGNQCSSSSSIDVVFEILGKADILNINTTMCISDSILLLASTYNNPVNYHWYEGTQSNFTLIETTLDNHIQVIPEHEENSYFLIVTNENCTSINSDTIIIKTIPKPIAKILSNVDNICVSDTIFLTSNMPTGTDINFLWLGPDNYMSVEQNSIIPNAELINDGMYGLIVSKGICFSDTVSKLVHITEPPEKPIINSSGLFCEGSDVRMSITNIELGDKYYWIKDGIYYSETNDKELIIPHATEELNGKWRVIAQYNNCYSDTSFSHEIIIEESLEIGISGPDSVCVGDSVKFSAPFIHNASYQWSGPAGFTYDQQNPTLLAIEGEYQLRVTTELGCMNATSLFLNVDNIPDITAISNDADDCLDGTTAVQFSASVFPEGDYIYSWTGPNNYISHDQNPVISNADSTINGYYTLIIENAACSSKPDSSLLEITNSPHKPSINIDSEYCEGYDIELTVNGDIEQGITYIWNTPLGQITTTVPTLEINNIGITNIGDYTVQLLKNTCPSKTSDTVTLITRPLPEKIGIIGKNIICEGDSITLRPSNTNLSGYEWKGPNNLVSNDSVIVINNFEIDDAGAYFVRYFDGYCFSEWSIPKVIDVQPMPVAAQFDSISDGVCLETDDIINICLDENTVSDGSIYHIYSVSSNDLIGSSSTRCFDVNNTSSLNVGANYLYIQTELNGCVSINSDTILVQGDKVPSNPIAKIDQGEEIHFCHDGATILSTKLVSGIDILWFSDEEYKINTPTDSTTIVSDFNLSINSVYLGYSYNSCKNYSIDTIDIYLEEEPVPYDDEVDVEYNKPRVISILDNDEYLSDIVISIDTSQNIKGKVSINDGKLIFTPDPGFVGELSFEYKICSKYCPELCSTATVFAKIGNNHDCFVANVITPNGDDINDIFTIPCLYSGIFSNNKLIVFNQWGDSVFEASPYNNDWSGTYNNEDLPSGTYYYILDLGDETEIIKGFLIIER